MALTPAQELALYENALEVILTTGQSISVNGRTLTRASLADIRARIKELQPGVRAASRGPIRAGFRRPSG